MTDPNWKKFESLVARIEEALAETGAVVKLDDHIRDLESGQMRQVDASIWYKNGSVPTFFTIECRERQKKDDATWIEHLESKKRSIGAHGTIAVSSSGFTKPAIEKAKYANIQLRHLTDLTPENLDNWLATFSVHVAKLYLDLKRFVPIYQDGTHEENGELSVNVCKLLEENHLNAAILRNLESKSMLTLKDLVDRYRIDNLDKFNSQIVADSEPQFIQLRCGFPADMIAIETENGLRKLQAVELSLEAKKERESVPASRSFAYSDSESVAIQGLEFHTEAFTGKDIVTILRDTEAGAPPIVQLTTHSPNDDISLIIQKRRKDSNEVEDES